MIGILIRAHNAGELLLPCIRSVSTQTNSEWRIHLFLDDPTPKTARAVLDARKYLKYHPLVTETTTRRGGPARTMWHGIDAMVRYMNNDDIITVLDGDDRYATGMALSRIQQEYDERPHCRLTYGSYLKVSVNRRTKISQAYPKKADVRKHPWRASHAKSFRVDLAKYLRKDHFLDNDGNYLKAASDLALMFPLIEMAGLENCRHIHDLIYTWNDNHGGNCDRETQRQAEAIVRGKKKEKRIAE